MMTDSNISLLSQGLSLLEWRPNNAFVLDGCQRHLEALAYEANRTGVVPRIGDESILVKLSKVSLPLMLSWARKVGEKAWKSTPENPYPLADLLEGPLYNIDEALSQIDSNSLKETLAGIRDMVAEGIRVAMPLKNSGIEKSNAMDIEDRQPLYHAQTQISNAGLRDHPWADANWTAEQIEKNGGAWLFSRSPMAQEITSIPAFTPDKRVAFYNTHESILLMQPWQWVWNLRGRPHSGKVLDWMQAHGMDVREMKEDEFLKNINKVAADSDRTLKDRWTDILRILKALPGSENKSCRFTGLPYGLYALRSNGALLSAALKQPPAGGLHAKGPRGHTIWDAVLVPEHPTVDVRVAPWTAIAQLMKKVPIQKEGLGLLKSGGRSGLLWQPHSPQWIGRLAEETLLTHPHLWTGTPERSEEGAMRLLVSLTCREDSAKWVLNASDSAGHLASLWEHHPDMFTPRLKDIFLVMRETIAGSPERFTDLGRNLLTAPMPTPEGSDWWLLTRPVFEKKRGTYSGSDPSVLQSENLLDSMMQEAEMNIQLPQHQPHPSRKVRF